MLAGAAGCGAVYRTQAFRSALDARNPEQARSMLDAVLVHHRSKKPKQSGHDVGRLLLERSSVRMALGDFAGSRDDLDQAERLLDRQAMGRSRYLTGGYNPKATVYVYERGWRQALNLPYGAKFYERLLINPLAAVSRLELRESAGACIEARRFGVMADWTEQVAPKRAAAVRAFGELVATFACASVEPGLACGSLQRAQALSPGIAQKHGVSCTLPAGGRARLGVLIGYGRPSHPLSAPEKPDEVTLVSGGETGVEQPTLRVDEQTLAAPEVLDVDAAVRADYYEGEHAFSMRLLGQETQYGCWSGVAWEGLPAHIHLAVLELAPGPHHISVEVRGERRERDVRLAPLESRSVWVSAPW